MHLPERRRSVQDSVCLPAQLRCTLGDRPAVECDCPRALLHVYVHPFYRVIALRSFLGMRGVDARRMWTQSCFPTQGGRGC